METYLIIFLIMCNNLGIIVLNDEIKHIPTNSKCDDDGECENSGELLFSREKREEIQTLANKVTFDLSMSVKVVETFGLEQMFHGLENFLQEQGIIEPKDIFQLEMHPHEDALGNKRQKTSFVIPPQRKNANISIELLKSTDIARINGLDVFIKTNTFKHDIISWNGVRTAVSFELVVDYIWLIENDLHESTNQIATFLHKTFQIYRRDIYDLLITQAANAGATVEFSLPPLLSYTNVSNVLEDVKVFVDSCQISCKPTDGINTEDNCRNCLFTNIFGMNVYPVPQSFIWRSETWTCDEIRFEENEITQSTCPDHQELCVHGEPKCVGIGRCEKNFYKTVSVTIQAHGSIRLLDVYGLDYSKEVVGDSISALHGICRSSIEIIIFGQGRDTLGISVVLAPSIGRTEGVERLDERIKTKNEIEADNLVITKVEGSYRKTYLDMNKPLPKFISNDCFGCESSEVWCLLPNISLCLQKNRCIELFYSSSSFKISGTTEIIKLNVLIRTDEEYHSIDDDIKYDIKIQIAEQTNSRAEIFTFVDVVPSEDKDYYELGIVVMSIHNNTELRNVAINLHRLTDKEMLHIVTPSAVFTAVPNSILFRQFISGYSKTSRDESNSNDLGSIITGISIAVMAIVVTTILIIAYICRKRRRLYSNTSNKEKSILNEEKVASCRQQEQCKYMTRQIWTARQ